MVEAAERRHARIQGLLAGMAERGMAKVMGERDRLGEVVVERQSLGQRAGDLRDFDGVGQAGAEVVAFVEHEDLRLVSEAAEGGGMDDAVAVALERRACRRWRFQVEAPARSAGVGRVGRPVAARLLAALHPSPFSEH